AFCFVDVFHFLILSGVEVSGKPGALQFHHLRVLRRLIFDGNSLTRGDQSGDDEAEREPPER
ncbi:hypothetical protein, partial [Caballeronia sp. RCC_10]|uniref:hypothetical protein n=1 Tax=Caballeronia sp. RCC_10 TaxID=3239227 RepID=UPI003523531D